MWAVSAFESIEPTRPSTPGPGPGRAGGSPARGRHVVRAGEDFGTIARAYYGSEGHARALWWANRERVAWPEALKPGTAFAPYADLVPELDMILVMTVEPGFGGQSFMADQMPKVRQVREAVSRHGGEVWIQVDGGVSATTIEQCAEAGADVFVAGSAVYGADSAAGAVDALRALALRHAHP